MNSSPFATAMDTVGMFVEPIARQQLIIGAGGENVGVALAADDVQAIPCGDHRPPTADAGPLRRLRPKLFAGGHLEAVRGAALFDDIDVLADDDARTDSLRQSLGVMPSRSLVISPSPPSLTGRRRAVEARHRHDHAVGIQRRSVNELAQSRAEPQFLPRLGIETFHFFRHTEDELVLFADASDDRRAP